MFKGILRRLALTCLLALISTPLLAETEHFWLLHDSGIEKRSMEDGSLLEQVVQLYKPLTFAVDETNQKIWAVSDGYISSYDLEGNLLAYSELENINQGARLIANSEDGGAWLSHKGEIYRYNEGAQRLTTTELKLPGNQINDIALDATDSTLWLTSSNQVISISSDGEVAQHELDKDETVTGLTVTEAQEIAVSIATPKPEFRIYNQNLELQTTIPLPQEATNPVRIAASGENSFWIAAKQSVVLVDGSSGVVTTHPLTGERGLGPGVVDIFANAVNESAWVIVGRELLHISAAGELLKQSEILYKTLEIEKNIRNTSLPTISFPLSDSYNPDELNFSGSTYNDNYYTPPLPYGPDRMFYIKAESATSEIKFDSLKLYINNNKLRSVTKMNDFFGTMKLKDTDEFDAACAYNIYLYDGHFSISADHRWIICQFSDSILAEYGEGIHTFSASISDTTGNTSNVSSVPVIIDRTKPAVNTSLIEVIDSSNQSLTVKGHPGALVGGGNPKENWITRIRTGNSYSKIEPNDDGSFLITIPGFLGESLFIYTRDYASNYLFTFVRTTQYIDIHITSPASNDTLNTNNITVHGTHGGDEASVITVNGVTATNDGSTFTAYNVPVDNDGIIKADVRAPNGASGTHTIQVYIDSTPPSPPNPDRITLQYTSDNIARVSGQSYSVEANSTVTLTNTATGAIATTQADSGGRFNADITASYGNILTITATDKVGNVSQPTNLQAGYIIELQLTQPPAGSTVYSQKILVSGTHNGPEGTTITINGVTAAVNGTLFGGETEINPYTGTIEIIATGPNSGYGKASSTVIYKVPTPVAELIQLTFNRDETITLLGKPGSAIASGNITIYNTTRGSTKETHIAPDGSFITTISAVGGDSLTLVATDKNGIEGESTIIDAGYHAEITITSPVAGAEVGQYITVSGTHTGPIESVITINGVAATVGETTFTANNVPIDNSSTITVKLFSADGAYGKASINVVTDTTPPAAPNLELIATAFSAGNHVHVSGQPGSVEGGATLTISNASQSESKVLSVADDGSFSTYVPGLPGETLSLSAADVVGNQGDTSTLTLGSEAVITINSPYSNAIVPAFVPEGSSSPIALVTVTGSHAGPVNSGIIINGVVAAVTSNHFVALNVPVQSDGLITAKLTALDGSYGTAQVTVGLDEQPYLLSLAPSSTEGMAPHNVSFEWDAYTAESPSEVSIDYDGDGTFDQSSSDLTTPLEHDYTAAGISNVTLRITMADGSFYTAETVVVTQDSDHYDAIFLSLWNGMNDALLANEPLLALNYIQPRMQGEYYVTLKVIAPRMQAIVDSYRPPARSSVDEYYLEYIVPRSSDSGNLLYYVYCVRDVDGTWRIKEM